jgi:hypothetical protein
MTKKKAEIEELFIEELADVQGGIRLPPGKPLPPIATTFALGEESPSRPFSEHVTTLALNEEGGGGLI